MMTKLTFHLFQKLLFVHSQFRYAHQETFDVDTSLHDPIVRIEEINIFSRHRISINKILQTNMYQLFI